MAEKKFYLTEEKLKNIKKEYKDLQTLKIIKTKSEASNIWQSEDLNPEYLSFFEDISLLEARIADLDYVLRNAEIIKTPPKDKQNIISVGAYVTAQIDDQLDEFQIVGTLEANPPLGKISNESPVGRALLGHKVGDEVIISSPIKTIYKIKKIKYEIS
jgi:transcription elongation factor GreA